MKARVVAAGLLLAWTSIQSAAEPVQVLETEYKPLITTRSGIPELCGFHFSTIVVRASGQLVNIQGSMNTSFYAGRVPASMIKVSAVQQEEGVLKRVAILDASIRLGTIDTRKYQKVRGEDGQSILLALGMLVDQPTFMHFAGYNGEALWVSLTLDRSQTDISFQLPEFDPKSRSIIKDLAECNLVALEQLQSTMQSK